MRKSITTTYFAAMAAYWLVFGLITAFYPKLMDLFQTEAGIGAKTIFSDHVWRHDGFDIISVSVLLFALSRSTPSRGAVLSAAVVALLVTFAIVLSLLTTNYWSMLFLVPCLGCASFAVWGFVIATRMNSHANQAAVHA